jgi:hypothetical protein
MYDLSKYSEKINYANKHSNRSFAKVDRKYHINTILILQIKYADMNHTDSWLWYPKHIILF